MSVCMSWCEFQEALWWSHGVRGGLLQTHILWLVVTDTVKWPCTFTHTPTHKHTHFSLLFFSTHAHMHTQMHKNLLLSAFLVPHHHSNCICNQMYISYSDFCTVFNMSHKHMLTRKSSRNWAQNKGVAASWSSSGLTWHWPALETKMGPDSSFRQMSIYVTDDESIEARVMPPLCNYWEVWVGGWFLDSHVQAHTWTKTHMRKDHPILHMSCVQVAILEGLCACRMHTILHIAEIPVQYVAHSHLECICKALLCVENSWWWRGRVIVWKTLILLG